MTATECMVEGCEASAFKIRQLVPRRGWMDWPKEVAVCNLHDAELSKPEAEWLLANDLQAGVKLHFGTGLLKLNEFVLLESPDTIRGYVAGRDFSHPEEDGFHMPLKVRRRGGNPEEITLVLSREKIAQMAELLAGFGDLGK